MNNTTTSLPFLRLKTPGSRSSLPSTCPGMLPTSRRRKSFESWRKASCDFLVVSHSGDHAVPSASLLGLLWSLSFDTWDFTTSVGAEHNAVRRPRSRVRCRDVRAHRGELLVSPGCSSSTSSPLEPLAFLFRLWSAGKPTT